MFPALRHRDFRLLWLGNVGPQLSTWIEGATLGWLTLEVTDQPVYLGLVAFMRGLPILLFAPGFGFLVDRWNRRRMLLSGQVAALAITLCMVGLLSAGRVEVPVLLAFAFLMGTVATVHFPAQQALLSDLTDDEDRVNAVALHAVGNHGSRIAGPSLAGQLIQHVSITAAFAVQVACHVWGILCFRQIRAAAGARQQDRASIRQGLAEGWRYMRATPEVAAVMGLMTAVMLVGLSYADFLPYFARDRLGANAGQYGQLLAAFGWGSFLAALAMGLARTIARPGTILLAACVTYGVVLILLATSSSVPVSAVILTLMGASSSLYFSMNQALIQMVTPGYLRGRVLGIYYLTSGAQPVGSLVLGFVAQAYGTVPVFFIAGAVCLSTALLVALLVPGLRRPIAAMSRQRV